MLGLNNNIIELVNHSSDWSDYFNNEKTFLIKIAEKYIRKIEHIGSTAIKNIKAKPIIDMMIGLIDFSKVDECSSIFEKNNYINKGEFGIPERIFFIKSINDITTHHLHVVQYDSSFWKKHIHFRDLLNSNDIIRNEYQNLKENLKLKYKNNRELYTSGKTDFINKVLNEYKE